MEVNIYVNYKTLEQNEMKYLGIYFDRKYNFNAHIDYTVAKLITLVNMLGRTAKLLWGLGHKAQDNLRRSSRPNYNIRGTHMDRSHTKKEEPYKI